MSYWERKMSKEQEATNLVGFYKPSPKERRAKRTKRISQFLIPIAFIVGVSYLVWLGGYPWWGFCAFLGLVIGGLIAIYGLVGVILWLTLDDFEW